MNHGTKENRRNMPIVVGLFLLFLFPTLLPTASMAQETALAANPVTAKSTVKVVPEEHSARKAMMLSLLPGAGQIYNGQAWKVPVIYAAFAGMGYAIHYNYTRMDMFKEEYLHRVNNNGSPNLADYASYPTTSIYNLYNSYNRNFQLMVIITVGVYALNLIDAYVFGHLYDFQITDDLSLSLMPSLQPSPLGFQPSMGVSLSF